MKPTLEIGQVWTFYDVAHKQSFSYLITNIATNDLGTAYITIEAVGTPPPGWSRGLSGMRADELLTEFWTYEGTHSTIEEIML